MNNKNKNLKLNLLGIFFLLLSMSAITNTIYVNIDGIFWICYISLILISIGILIRDDTLILSQLNILTIPLLVWIIDFLSFFIYGKTLLGITDYFFVNNGDIIGKIISLQHLFTVPLSLYALYIIKLKRKDAWKISFIQVILVFIISVYITSQESNLNYVYRFSNFNLNLGFLYYIFWFIGYFSMIFITNFVIVMIFKNSKAN